VVDGSLSWLECRTWATYDGGDHTIVVGEVLSLGTGEPADPTALIYHSSHYRNLPGN
jgi:flavin reductase (DIM6/NTAB) family NADH-FMN oxidoreductase RutF